MARGQEWTGEFTVWSHPMLQPWDMQVWKAVFHGTRRACKCRNLHPKGHRCMQNSGREERWGYVSSCAPIIQRCSNLWMPRQMASACPNSLQPLTRCVPNSRKPQRSRAVLTVSIAALPTQCQSAVCMYAEIGQARWRSRWQSALTLPTMVPKNTAPVQ